MKECDILGGQNIPWPLLHIFRGSAGPRNSQDLRPCVHCSWPTYPRLTCSDRVMHGDQTRRQETSTELTPSTLGAEPRLANFWTHVW